MGTIGFAVYKLLDLISFLIIVRCIMSWVPGGTQNRVYEIITTLTNPIEEPIRSVMYKFMNGPIDFSPIVAILLVRLAQRVIVMMMY